MESRSKEEKALSNKVKMLSVTGRALLGFFKYGEKHFMVQNGLPADAKVLGVRLITPKSSEEVVVQLLISSEEYEEIGEEESVPEVPTIQAVMLEKVTEAETLAALGKPKGK